VFALSCCAWLFSCGGIAEYTDYDPQDNGAPPGPSPEPIPDCSGDFTSAEVLFEDEGWISQALAPSADGLEFYYARQATDRSLDDSGTRLPTLRKRPTTEAAFGEPVVLSELATACEVARPGTSLGALDISRDGLRLYIGCSAFIYEEGASGPLLVVEREHLGAEFTPPASIIGEVGISLGLTRDELTAYGTTLDPSVRGVLRYKRNSINDSFGPGEIAPGEITMINPEPTPEGGELWGAVAVPGSTRRQLAFSAWQEAAGQYGPPTEIALTPPAGSSDYSPALSSDCRTLYFARHTTSPRSVSRVMIAYR
jgi:hypothetical protein